MEYCYEWDGFLLRTARLEDAEAYYTQNFAPLDAEVARLTGCKAAFSREEITAYFQRFADSKDGYLFLLFSPTGEIIGESVIRVY